jgi:RNA polymerase sigma factor (sigma-70 family)
MSVNEVIHKSLESYKYLRYFAYTIGNKGADAEDLVQTAYMKMLKYKETLQPGNIHNLLTTIIKHESFNNYRKQKRVEYRKIKSEELVSELEQELDEEVSTSFENALRVIPLNAVFYLCAIADGKSYADIAAKEGVTISKVRTTVHNARKKLQPLLEKAYRTCLPSSSKRREERLLWLSRIA